MKKMFFLVLLLFTGISEELTQTVSNIGRNEWDILMLIDQKYKIGLDIGDSDFILNLTRKNHSFMLPAQSLFSNRILPEKSFIYLKLQPKVKSFTILSIIDPNHIRRLHIKGFEKRGTFNEYRLSIMLNPLETFSSIFTKTIEFTVPFMYSSWTIGILFEDTKLTFYTNCDDVDKPLGYHYVVNTAPLKGKMFQAGATIHLFNNGNIKNNKDKFKGTVSEFVITNYTRIKEFMCREDSIEGSGTKANFWKLKFFGNVLITNASTTLTTTITTTQTTTTPTTTTPTTTTPTTTTPTTTIPTTTPTTPTTTSTTTPTTTQTTTTPTTTPTTTTPTTTSTTTTPTTITPTTTPRTTIPTTKSSTTTPTTTTSSTTTIPTTTPTTTILTTTPTPTTTTPTTTTSTTTTPTSTTPTTTTLTTTPTTTPTMATPTTTQTTTTTSTTTIPTIMTTITTRSTTTPKSTTFINIHKSKLSSISTLTSFSSKVILTNHSSKLEKSFQSNTFNGSNVQIHKTTEITNRRNNETFLRNNNRTEKETITNSIPSIKGEKGERGYSGYNGSDCECLKHIRLNKPEKASPGIKGMKGDKGKMGQLGSRGFNGTCSENQCRPIFPMKGNKGDDGNPGYCSKNLCNQLIQQSKGTKGNIGSEGQQGQKGDKGDKTSVPDVIYSIIPDIKNSVKDFLTKNIRNLKGEQGSCSCSNGQGNDNRKSQIQSMVLNDSNELKSLAATLNIGQIVFLIVENVLLIKIDEVKNRWRIIKMDDTQSDLYFTTEGGNIMQSQQIGSNSNSNSNNHNGRRTFDTSFKLMLIALSNPTAGDLRSVMYEPGAYSGSSYQCQKKAYNYGLGRAFYPLINTDTFDFTYMVPEKYRYSLPIVNRKNEKIAQSFEDMIKSSIHIMAPILDFKGNSIMSSEKPPCIWIGRKPTLYENKQPTEEGLCLNWMSRRNNATGSTTRISVGRPLLDIQFIEETPCKSHCYVLCMQIYPLMSEVVK